MQPELIADYACEVGEGPLWHPTEKKLYWDDWGTGRIFRFAPATGEHEVFHKGPMIGGFTVQADGALLLFMEGPSAAVLRDGKLTYIVDGLPNEEGSHFNDIIADPAGRVFCGTVPAESRIADSVGRLYRLETDGSITAVVEGIGITNGLGFTPDRKHLYYTDSAAQKIYLFDYDQESGEISNQRVFVELSDGEALPDGMTVDADGYVWSAMWDGSSLVRYSPDGAEVMRVGFPAKKVSSVTFGGEDYSDMYVTTAAGENKAEEGSGAGALYRLRAGVRGVPEFRSRVGL